MTVSIRGFGHVGIRVHDLDRSVRFYGLLGFELLTGRVEDEPVAILHHPGADLELNLVLNAPSPEMTNLLMDVPGSKPPGITHLALVCDDLDAATEVLEAAGYPIRDRVTFPTGVEAIFVRDPDGTVVELDALPEGWTVREAVTALEGRGS